MGNSQYFYRLANMAGYYILQPDLVVPTVNTFIDWQTWLVTISYSQTWWCLMGNSQYFYRLANMAGYYILQPDLVVLDGQQSILL